MRRFLATVALTAMLAAGAAAPSTPGVAAAPVLVPQAASCSGVWVVVDFGSLGGITTKCATSYGTGEAALRSAGFSPTIIDRFVYKLSGKPRKPDINKAYWSYWHATRKADGGYNGWTYSNLGATSYHPTAGNAEGWRYQSLDDGKVPPGAAPPAGTDTPKPTPSKTSSKPSPKPSPSKKPSASSKPSATATASASAKAGATSRTPTATASSGTSTTPTPAGQPSPSDAAVPTPSEVATDPLTQATPVTESADASSSGSPVGLIATVGIVLAGAAGLGGWWWKGRKS